MKVLRKLIPSNVQQEKQKFLADDSYNPQFEYSTAPEMFELDSYGYPKPELVAKAQEVLDKAYFGRNERDLLMMQGKVLTQSEVTEKFTNFLRLHHLENRYKISWSSSFLSRATMTESSINLKNGAEFRKEGILGTLYHEIGTHALRRINYEKQPWFKRKKKFGFSSYLKTEEGLAILNSLVPQSFKSAYSSALRYVAVAYAQEHSFAELSKLLSKYMESPERRWNLILRLKRGVTDTSQPGGFTKDLTYFEGMVEVGRWLDQNNYNLAPLYFGKLAVEDIDRAYELNPGYSPILPSFYLVDPEKYGRTMREILEYNELLP